MYVTCGPLITRLIGKKVDETLKYATRISSNVAWLDLRRSCYSTLLAVQCRSCTGCERVGIGEAHNCFADRSEIVSGQVLSDHIVLVMALNSSGFVPDSI
jgi:hypothetical protein